MANTGRHIARRLRLRNITTDTLTGDTKLNLPGDPDYAAPTQDTDTCPVPTGLVCPEVIAGISGFDSILYNFSLPNQVIVNSGIVTLRVILKTDGGATVDSHDYTVFTPNYFAAEFTGLTEDIYLITLEYRDAEDVLIHSCPDIFEVNFAPVITWEGIDPFCVTTPDCAEGYTYDETTNTCMAIDSVASTPPSGGGGTPADAAHVTNVQWNNGGAQVFAPGYSSNGSGTIAAALITPHFWVNGNFQWDTAGRNTTDSRMNAAGVWVAGETSDPLDEWIGFVRVISIPEAKTYYLGICADNKFRVAVNGTIIIDCPGSVNGSANFNYMNIYPITLPQGANIIEMWAMNTSSVGGMAMEIYDMTLAELTAAEDVGDLNIIFSTANMFGEPFNLGETVGYSCPVDYYLNPDDPSQCIQITYDDVILLKTGMKGFENRIRLVNGVADGFEEPNIDGEGVGTYVAPVSDETTCPPDIL